MIDNLLITKLIETFFVVNTYVIYVITIVLHIWAGDIELIMFYTIAFTKWSHITKGNHRLFLKISC